jgi:hypothetical protein
MLDEDIKNAVGPLVQGHVHPLRRRQRDGNNEPEELPVVVYTFVGDDWMTAQTICGPGLHNTRVQLDVYDITYRGARDLAYQVADAMNALGWRMSLEPFPDDDERIWRWKLEVSCWRNDRAETRALGNQTQRSRR